MLRRSIFVFLMPMFLVACQPKEVAITENQKAKQTINKDTKADVTLVCPLFSILKDSVLRRATRSCRTPSLGPASLKLGSARLSVASTAVPFVDLGANSRLTSARARTWPQAKKCSATTFAGNRTGSATRRIAAAKTHRHLYLLL